jgi:hypothetical protein
LFGNSQQLVCLGRDAEASSVSYCRCQGVSVVFLWGAAVLMAKDLGVVTMLMMFKEGGLRMHLQPAQLSQPACEYPSHRSTG